MTMYDARRIININELRCDFHRLREEPSHALYKINRQTGSVAQVDGPLKTRAPIPFHGVILSHCVAFYDNSDVVEISLRIEAQRARIAPERAATFAPMVTECNTSILCVSHENVDGGLFEISALPSFRRELSPSYMVAVQNGVTWGFTVARSFDNRNDGIRDIFVVTSFEAT